ncbi:MAG: hypothetical protein NTY45_10475 [Elusimicrobia bacterium]|nr:hypothetical protein [Elusimicrobiota bacterium]
MCALTGREEGDQRDLAALFDKSRFNTADFTAQFNLYSGVCRTPELWSKVSMAAAKADGLAGFYRTLPRALARSSADPAAAARKAEAIRGALSRFAPVYEELVWAPSLDKIRAVQGKLAGLSRETDFSALYSSAAAFYRSSYKGPLLVVLVPVPGGGGGSQPLLENIFFFEIPLYERSLDPGQLASSYGVIFHEMCHMLYAHKDAAVERKIAGIAGEKRGSDWAVNEALAISAGMWAERKLSGGARIWNENCGYDARTCAYAKALYPLVAQYLDAARHMDGEFFSFAGQQYRLLPLPAGEETPSEGTRPKPSFLR